MRKVAKIRVERNRLHLTPTRADQEWSGKRQEKKEGKGDVITLAYNKDLAEQFNDALKYLLANNLVVGHENVAPEMYDLEIAVFIKKARQQARRKLQEEEK